MAKKKKASLPVSQEDNAQVQRIFEQYHQTANDLQTSVDQKQAETALAAINTMPEGAQIALLKALSKEHHTDAADVLAAINELSPIKSVRKEAHRSLIQQISFLVLNRGMERYAFLDFYSSFGMMALKISSLELTASAALTISLLECQRRRTLQRRIVHWQKGVACF